MHISATFSLTGLSDFRKKGVPALLAELGIVHTVRCQNFVSFVPLVFVFFVSCKDFHAAIFSSVASERSCAWRIAVTIWRPLDVNWYR